MKLSILIIIFFLLTLNLKAENEKGLTGNSQNTLLSENFVRSENIQPLH